MGVRRSPYAGSFCPDLAEFQTLYGQLHQVILDVEAGWLAPADAVTRLSQLLEADFLPSPLQLSDVLRRWHEGSFESQRQMYEWGRNAAPTPLRRWYDYDLDELVARTEAEVAAHAVGAITVA